MSPARTAEQKGRWQAQVEEEPLDPGQRICDPHHHLWQRPGNDYLLPELWRDTGSGHDVRRTVFVECMSGYREDGPEALRPVGETELVARLARESRRAGTGAVIEGIVGYADLTLGTAVDEVLAAHLEAGDGLFCGVRHAAGHHDSPEIRNSHTRPPANLFGRSDFREGFARLASHGLSFDAWLYHPQLSELTALARTFPEVPIVLDHFGGPLGIGPYAGRADEVFAHWRREIEELSHCENVAVKLGGLAMPLNGFGWHKRDMPPTSEELARSTGRYYLYTIDLFTPQRCMFESNFPVDSVSCSYQVLWNSFKRLVEAFSDDEKDQLFWGTASRFYRLGRSAAPGDAPRAGPPPCEAPDV